ncbi:Ribonuclease Z OS=Streptomyces albaduncus OX=68172 GN=rnz PE=3 SV=1 [Streptomyces griseoloalbus]
MRTPGYTLEARRLSHPVEAYGYRLVEPDGRRMPPARLAAHGIAGPEAVGRLQRAGALGRGRPGGGLRGTGAGSGSAFARCDTRLC